MFLSLHIVNGWGWVCARWAELLFGAPPQAAAPAMPRAAGDDSAADGPGRSRAAGERTGAAICSDRSDRQMPAPPAAARGIGDSRRGRTVSTRIELTHVVMEVTS